MTEKRWLYKPTPETPDETACVHDLCARLGTKGERMDHSLATLIWQRGMREFDEAREFFRPRLDQLHDPFAMRGMAEAVERLTQAIVDGEKIMIYGDYDVDGTTSVALFYGFLNRIYDQVAFEFYIPDRYKEGYGVQRTGIDYAHEHGFTLIVTLDCGIKSVELVAEAKELGIDFIICDHHRPGAELPPAVAVLDPKRSDCHYPFKELTGCGVGFKLLQGFCQQNGIPGEQLFNYLDLLVVSIASDIVPILGENRVLSHFGLKRLNEAPRPGLKALIEIAGFQKKITDGKEVIRPIDISSVVFGLGPRINAAGRIKHAHEAVKLLLAETEEEARTAAQGVNVHNTDRRDFDTRITQEALAMIEADEGIRPSNSTVLFKNDWHKGVIGIVASRCIEKYYRPTIILTESHEKAAGSARSVAGFDVYEAIEECSELLEQFGGHMYAAGLTLQVANVPAFRKKFEEVVTRRIRPEQQVPQIEVDMRLSLSQVTDKFHRIVNQMQPFGPQNMAPVFVSENVKCYGVPQILKEKHLKLTVYQDGTPAFSAIGFGMAHFYANILNAPTFHICYQIDVNEFRGQRNLQLMLKDLKF